MKIVGVLQVREGSTRLPRKALMDLGGWPLIRHVWERLNGAGTLSECIVSTSAESPNVVGWCKLNDIPHYVGSENDLLSRHLGAAAVTKADAILRVTGDCPFHDPRFLDQMVTLFAKHRPDALMNWADGRSYSEGLDAEVVSVKIMRALNDDPNCPREDWLSYLSKHRVMAFKQPWSKGADLHLSVDTPEDFDRSRKMIEWLGSNRVWDYKSTLEAYEGVQSAS